MRVVQYYALIIASWAHGNCDWAGEIVTHAINRLEVVRLQLAGEGCTTLRADYQKRSGDRKKVVFPHGLTSMGAGGCE